MLFNWNMAVVWLVVLVICLAVEIATLGLTSIWFAIGALAATVAALLNLPLWMQNNLPRIASKACGELFSDSYGNYTDRPPK